MPQVVCAVVLCGGFIISSICAQLFLDHSVSTALIIQLWEEPLSDGIRNVCCSRTGYNGPISCKGYMLIWQ